MDTTGEGRTQIMKHQTALSFVNASVDGQLGPIRRLMLARHLARCTSCRGELERLYAMRTALRTNLTVYRAPPGLAARIGSALPREAPPELRRSSPWLPRSGFAMGGALVGAALTLALVWLPARPSSDSLASEVISGHVRSMMADHLTDVLTSDQHTVKPWLSARLNFSPVVKDFVADGFPLVGGRLDYVAGREAAAVVYRRDKHTINLFAFVADKSEDAPPALEQRDGFNVIRWRMGGLTYVAVSDVEASQLETFVKLVRGAAA
jgi:anti-sigma factor RsiW